MQFRNRGNPPRFRFCYGIILICRDNHFDTPVSRMDRSDDLRGVRNQFHPRLATTTNYFLKAWSLIIRLEAYLSNLLAAGPGFEPGFTAPKAAVLPLDDPALGKAYLSVRAPANLRNISTASIL